MKPEETEHRKKVEKLTETKNKFNQLKDEMPYTTSNTDKFKCR